MRRLRGLRRRRRRRRLVGSGDGDCCVCMSSTPTDTGLVRPPIVGLRALVRDKVSERWMRNDDEDADKVGWDE